ncbi:MAG: MotA/TolQ/ExbB proton channel family protein [Deltaproteobacteria bacterium]|nr:MotA/TolQ/ExbB proton channel family protein [Deltaproteobacteria bacterium]
MNPLITIILSLGIFLFMLPIIRNTGVEMFFNLDALLIIGSGTLIGLFVGFPVQRIKTAFFHVKESFGDRGNKTSLLKEILLMAGVYKRGNIREIERRQAEIQDDLFRMGMHLLINQHPMEEITNLLEREMVLRIVNQNLSQNILKTLARLTPALGLAGTIISLIKMFDHFQSIETMTPMMAVALMSTFYGVIISNLIMLPLSSKLKEKAILSESLMAMTIEGLVAISEKEHPLKIEEKLAGIDGVEEAPALLSGRDMAWGEINR